MFIQGARYQKSQSAVFMVRQKEILVGYADLG